MPRFWKPKYDTIETIPDQDVARIMELMDRSWDDVASEAWEGYLLSGRGCLFCDFDAETTTYFAATSPVIRATRDPMWRDVQLTCRVYNPEREVVMVLHHFLHETSSLGLKYPTPEGKLPPPIAHRRQVETAQVRDALQSAARAQREARQ